MVSIFLKISLQTQAFKCIFDVFLPTVVVTLIDFQTAHLWPLWGYPGYFLSSSEMNPLVFDSFLAFGHKRCLSSFCSIFAASLKSSISLRVLVQKTQLVHYMCVFVYLLYFKGRYDCFRDYIMKRNGNTLQLV